MNGHPSRPPSTSGFPAALLASCLLHLSFILLPYWGGLLEISHGLDHDTPTVSARLLNVTLVPHRAITKTSAPSSTPSPTPTAPSTPPLHAVPQTSDAAHSPTPEATSSYAENPILPLDAPKFYPAEQLTHSPVPLEFKELDTPETSNIIATGQMTIKLWIDEQGAVVHVSVEKTNLPPTIVESTVTSFQQMRFTPGERYGQAVGSLITIEVNYDDGRQPQSPSAVSATSAASTATPAPASTQP